MLQLRDQNTALREELGGAGGGDGVDEDTVLDLGDEAEKLVSGATPTALLHQPPLTLAVLPSRDSTQRPRKRASSS